MFNRTGDSAEKYNEAKARETLETVLLVDGQYEKRNNLKYDQDEFLDDLIKSEIPGSDVKGDVAIIGEYAYELDRSVPKIGKYLGKASDLVFPTVTVTEPELADDYRSSSFTITATEEKNGINKIEIWLLGEKVEEYTYTDGLKTPRTETYVANRNGVYTIKAYGKLWVSKRTTVTGVVPAVEFSPNGSTEWKKQHSTKITVRETGEKVKELKYKWTDSVNPPADFSDAQSCNNGDTITGGDETMTGTYYLWILLTTESNKTNICGSEGFKFDNEAPIVELTSTPVSETSFKVTTTANDTHSKVASCEIYLDGEKVTPQVLEDETKLFTWEGSAMVEKKECYVVVTDNAGNEATRKENCRTLLHHWTSRKIIKPAVWELVKTGGESSLLGCIVYGVPASYWKEKPDIDSSTRQIPNNSDCWRESCTKKRILPTLLRYPGKKI